MKVLILGMGYTGQRLAKWLLQNGKSVIGTNRSGLAIPGIACPVLQFKDHLIVQGNAFQDAIQGVTHVISTIAPMKTGEDPGMSVLSQLSRQSIRWAGYLSTTGVYGDTGGAWVDELSPLNPGNVRSQMRVNVEGEWQRSGLPVHIFRLPGIYGPTRSIFEKIKSGKAQNIIKPGHVFSRVHVDDIVQTVGKSMLSPTPGEIYNVGDDEPSEPSALLLEGSRLLNLEPPPPILFEDAQFSPMGRSFWNECRRVSNQKIKEKLGINLFYPSYREGLRAILASQ